MTQPPSLPGGAETTFRLLERVREGDREALETVLSRYAGPLRRWAHGRLPQRSRAATDTQDLVQDTLLQTLKTIGTFVPRHEGALQAYLRQAVMNRIRDELRRVGRRGEPAAIDSQIEQVGPSPVELAIGQQALERYERALGRLRPEDKEVIVARLELECSYEQIAEMLGKPSAEAARKAARRALIKLAAEMKRDC